MFVYFICLFTLAFVALWQVRVISKLEEQLGEAQKNDYRDPKTGRFVKAKK